jgi:hypothetical protein
MLARPARHLRHPLSARLVDRMNATIASNACNQYRQFSMRGSVSLLDLSARRSSVCEASLLESLQPKVEDEHSSTPQATAKPAKNLEKAFKPPASKKSRT